MPIISTIFKLETRPLLSDELGLVALSPHALVALMAPK